MMNHLGPPISPRERNDVDVRLWQVTRRAYQDYLGIDGDTPPTAGMLLWYGDMIDHNPKGSYQLAAGSCAVEAALHADEVFSLEDRVDLIRRAASHWDRAYDAEAITTNDIAERAKWSSCQVPTYGAVAAYIEGRSAVSNTWSLQEAMFKSYFRHILDRWPHEDLRGHALESLCSYFLHRSNRLRPKDQPLHALPAFIRDDYHPDPRKRVDVSVFDLHQGMKHGIQVKSGMAIDPHQKDNRLFRIFLSEASRLLCIPYSESSVLRTIQAIVEDDPKQRNDLDTIAADHRARIIRRFVIPGYAATLIVNRSVSTTAES